MTISGENPAHSATANGMVSHPPGAMIAPGSNGGTLQLALSNSFTGIRDAVIRFRMMRRKFT
jgi:hypothetical protein